MVCDCASKPTSSPIIVPGSQEEPRPGPDATLNDGCRVVTHDLLVLCLPQPEDHQGWVDLRRGLQPLFDHRHGELWMGRRGCVISVLYRTLSVHDLYLIFAYIGPYPHYTGACLNLDYIAAYVACTSDYIAAYNSAHEIRLDPRTSHRLH